MLIPHFVIQALAGGPFIQARNFAVMTGANAGISCVMKRIRGKDDVQTRYVLLDLCQIRVSIFVGAAIG